MAEVPEDVRKIIDGIVASANADVEFARRVRENPLPILIAAGVPPDDAAMLLDAFSDPDHEVGGYMVDGLGFYHPVPEDPAPDKKTPP